jgi:hypothetical protein
LVQAAVRIGRSGFSQREIERVVLDHRVEGEIALS